MRLAALPLLVFPLCLAGCSLGINPASTPVQGGAIQGNVHGGQQPVVGAHVYLMAAATTGYGAASSSLLSSATGHSDSIGNYVLTDANGAFSITGDYNCTPGTQVYAYALGGNPGAGVNSAAGFLAVVGTCPALTTFAVTAPYIWMNEVSTVAAAYAMSGYATTATSVSSPSTTLALSGIATAFATAPNLVNLATGVALTATPAGNAVVPQATINSIANILAACVNSAGPTSTACAVLFATAKSGGSSGATATDTATAAINIAHNPGTNVAALFAVQTGTAAFSPSLLTAPNDFTLGLNFTGGGISKPESLAVDASGNIWIANYGTIGITKILSAGAALNPGAFAPNSPFTGAGVGISEGIAIDNSGNAWVANYTKNTLSEFGPTGTGLVTTVGGNLSNPSSLAIDSNGFVWVGNSTPGRCIGEFTSLGTAQAPNGYGAPGCSGVYAIAIDATSQVWPVSNDVSTLVGFNGSGAAVPGTVSHAAIRNGGIASPTGVAVDSSAHIWVSNGAKNSTTASEYSTVGATLTGPGGYTGGGLSTPYSVAVDGAGNIWFPNSGGSSVTELNSSGAPLSPAPTATFNGGYTGGNLNDPYSIAIDGSGNVWVADEGSNTVIELVGLATPVVTPIAAALRSPYLPGSKP